MGKLEDTGYKNTANLITEMMTDEQDGEEFSREYIKAGFLSSAMRTLVEARRQAGLTQTEVAERLHTKQAAIARWEKDKDGSMSLRHFVEFLMACGKAPFDIASEALGALREYVIAHPETPRTQELYQAWIRKISEPPQVFLPINPKTLMAQAVVNMVPPTNRTISTNEGKRAVQFAEQYLKDERQLHTKSPQLPSDNVTNMSQGIVAST